MNPGGYTAEVTGLSPNATEKDVQEFFGFCGAIEHVEIVRAGEQASTAYVTFRNPHALETAILLSLLIHGLLGPCGADTTLTLGTAVRDLSNASKGITRGATAANLTGATILDQRVCITSWGHYQGEFDYWNHSSWKPQEESHSSHDTQGHYFVSSAGEAVTMTQDVVKTMLAQGYVLGKGALGKAKAFDESHGLSATAVSKVADLSERIGLTDKFCAGVEAARSVNQRYHITDTTRSAASATGRTAVSAATAVVNSSYFSKGALWMSGALSRAAQAAADLGSRGVNK